MANYSTKKNDMKYKIRRGILYAIMAAFGVQVWGIVLLLMAAICGGLN